MNPGSTPMTITALAKELGLAKSTVSDALRGTGQVASSTRERVRQEAERLGYRPDPMMSAFSRYRKKESPARGAVIAMVVQQVERSQVFEQGVEDSAQLGYQLQIFALDDYETQSALARVLHARGIAGVIFSETSSPIKLEADVWRHLACVYAGPYPGGGDGDCPIDLVRQNPFDCVVEAWNRARALRAKRIGLVLPLPAQTMNHLDVKTLAAYQYLQTGERGAPKLRPLLGALDATQKTVADWLQRNRPDVVLGAINSLYHKLRNSGARIPEELRFIALRKSGQRTDIAGMLVDRKQVNKVAIRHLDSLIRHRTADVANHQTTLVLKPEWSPGASFPETPFT